MKKKKAAEENLEWLSTYGILTAERILERFNIRITQDELMATLKDPESRYYHLLTVPLKNIFNGILVEQVYDYQVYAQKLLIDYKLSRTAGPDDDEEEKPGTGSEEELAQKQEELLQMGESFEAKKQEHRHLIAESQAWLINESSKSESLAALPEMMMFTTRVEQLMFDFQNFRTAFRTLIIDITALLRLVPGYFLDEEKMLENQASLDFNPDLVDVTASDSETY